MKPLEGILVVSLEQAVAAPYASCRLADAGARVIKIERPEGDFARGYDHLVKGESAYFVWLNRGKQSVCLDLKQARDRAALSAMLARADVFIQNLAPDAIDRLGFGLQELRARHPRLITCSITGYGEEGPYRDLKAYDLLVQAETGLAAITGNEHGLARTGVSIADISAGTAALQGIMTALFARERSGKGQHVATSLFHALSDWMNVPHLQHVHGGRVPARSGLNHPTIAPYGAYASRDGGQVLFAIQNEREWKLFCQEVLRQPEVAADPRFRTNDQRVANRPALDAAIHAVFAGIDRDEAVRRLQAANIAYGRVSTLNDLAAHPQNRHITVATPSGPVPVLAPGALLDGSPPEPGAVPGLGEHTRQVIEEFTGEDWRS
ncbi:CaiB/BaiF CoA transferase family protein [Geminicoccus flavidas]|uniref:CaiB/BaiF CoA transferase family protein n=1 Tax=Geminicoccus flavidas TaxID=2506407 RepID=UPI00135C29A9|nr:CaiB/BaiF CoA-transferase family protein [Geminicoccus flavidas]